MSIHDDLTTLVCLFHHPDRAQDAFNDLAEAGISHGAITRIGGPDQESDALDKSELATLGMPDKDYDHLKDGIRKGGVVVAVHAAADKVDTVEGIFHHHSADQIDEANQEDRHTAAGLAPVAAVVPLAAAAVVEAPRAPAPVNTVDSGAQTVIPIVEEKLAVGKLTVNQGGVRVFRRTIEIPVEETIGLREEHVTMDRRTVDRPVTDADQAFGERTIELTETAEQAIVSKSARVVGEVLVGKTSTEHMETVHDTVRRTEVEVEQIPGSAKTVDSVR